MSGNTQKNSSNPRRYKSNTNKNRRAIWISVLIILALIAVLVILLKNCKNTDKPVLSLSVADDIKADLRDEFTVDLVLSDLPDEIYPAASAVISFDKNKLEFTGVKQGTMLIYEGYNPLENTSEKAPQMISPIWSANTDISNKTGEISTIYLDMTSGENAYSVAGFKKGHNDVVIRLGFKLKDSVSSGDKIAVEILDAAFAVSGGDSNGRSLLSSGEYSTLGIKNIEINIK